MQKFSHLSLAALPVLYLTDAITVQASSVCDYITGYVSIVFYRPVLFVT
jgi:hypothetical protein